MLGWMAITFSAWVEKETERERSAVHSFFFFFQRSKWRNAGVQDGAMKAEEERN